MHGDPPGGSLRRGLYAWTQNQAAALRRLAKERWNGPLDLAHLAEEVEDSGNEVRNVVRSHLRRLIEHCLKLEHAKATDPAPAGFAPSPTPTTRSPTASRRPYAATSRQACSASTLRPAARRRSTSSSTVSRKRPTLCRMNAPIASTSSSMRSGCRGAGRALAPCLAHRRHLERGCSSAWEWGRPRRGARCRAGSQRLVPRRGSIKFELGGVPP